MQAANIDTIGITNIAVPSTPGWTLWPLVLCALLAATIIVWKLWQLSVQGARTLRLLDQVDGLVGQRMIAEALAAARESDTPGGRILGAGLARRAAGSDRVARSIENAGTIEEAALHAWLIPLATIAAVAPLLGFLGATLSAMRALDAAIPTGSGIAAALVPAAAGLAIAIPVTVMHAYLVSRIDRLVQRIRESARRAVDAVHAIETAPGG